MAQICRATISTPKANEFATKALETDPKLYQAHELMAKVALEDDNHKKAGEEADAALAIQPDAVDAIAIKASIDLLADKESPWVAKIGNRGKGYETIAHFYVINRRYEEGIQYYRKAIAATPDLWSAHSQLGINLMRLAREGEARKELELAYENHFRDADGNTLTLMDSYKKFETFETPTTVLKLNKKEADVLRPYFQAEMLRAMATYEPNRTGILTNAGVLASQSHTTLPSAVLRGKLVREQVLCNVIPARPANIPPAPTTPPDGGTFRQQFEAAHDLPGCIACHQYMDAIGWGFGHFDATGAYQETDSNGFSGGTFPSIDATGAIQGMNPGNLGYGVDGRGAPSMGSADLTSPARRLHPSAAVLRPPAVPLRAEPDRDLARCLLRPADRIGVHRREILAHPALMVVIVGTDAFRYRSVETPGSNCQ